MANWISLDQNQHDVSHDGPILLIKLSMFTVSFWSSSMLIQNSFQLSLGRWEGICNPWVPSSWDDDRLMIQAVVDSRIAIWSIIIMIMIE